MDKNIQGFIKEFKGKEFKDFVLFVFKKMQKDIDLKKKKQDKDKYIKVRQNFLNYIIANEKAITIELNKKYK
jgi:hypothetical protein